jgi:hypothetical protein
MIKKFIKLHLIEGGGLDNKELHLSSVSIIGIVNYDNFSRVYTLMGKHFDVVEDVKTIENLIQDSELRF